MPLSLLQPNRRTLLLSLVSAAFTATAGRLAMADEVTLHRPLPAWSEGHFDIHHIDTGRGNSTLLIFPDGTTMLVDAGAVPTDPSGSTAPARPNDTRRPGEWQARYILAHAPSPRLDYFLATHLHPDHISGLADVAAVLPIGTSVDRAFPHYAATQPPPSMPSTEPYLAWLRVRQARSEPVEAARVGSRTQIAQRHRPERFPSFSCKVLAANGKVCRPSGDETEDVLGTSVAPENDLSVALRFTYGPFSYYTGGDLNCDTQDGREPSWDVETPVARAAGQTEIAVANHHGYFDACGPAFTNTLNAQVYIVPAWDAGHPGSAQIERMLGSWSGKPTQDVFTLELLPANALINRRFVPQLKSQRGHVVVRVAPGGARYTVYTLDSSTENHNVTGIFGPYTSRT